MPEELILEKIRKVRRRLNVQRTFKMLARFLFCGMILCVPLFVVDSFIATLDISPIVLIWVALGISAIGIIASLFRPINLQTAAQTIDVKASLKDRAASGLEFMQQQTDEVLTALQLKDASDRLEKVPANEVISYSIPRETKYAALVIVVALAFSYIEFFSPAEAPATLDFSPQIAAEADHLLEQIEKVEEEAEQTGLEDVVKEIKERILELKQENSTPKEALAKLSEIDAVLQSQMKLEDVAKTDALLKALGEQLADNPNLSDFGQALKSGQYEKSAERLFKLSQKLKSFNPEQRQNVSDALERGGSSLQGTQCDSLGTDLAQAGRAVRKKNSDSTRQYLLAAAQKLSDCAGTKKCNSLLAKLKAQCQACKAGIAGACSGNRPGTATDKNPLGALTELDGYRQLERITGVQGDGDSTIEEITQTLVAEDPESAGTQTVESYEEAYTKYQQFSEDALAQEQIPLGYKFYVKRYFESIKPNEE